MRARFYEPWTGRFLSEDPALDGINWYSYANNAPTHFSDIHGTSGIEALWAAALAFAVTFVIISAVKWNDGGWRAAIFPAMTNAVVAALTSLASTRIANSTRHLAQASQLAAILKISVGAAINLVATFLVDSLTSAEMTPMDYVCAAIGGGVSGGMMGSVGFTDDILGGMYVVAIPEALKGAEDFRTR